MKKSFNFSFDKIFSIRLLFIRFHSFIITFVTYLQLKIFISRFDPVNLLCQLILTFNTTPEDQFVSESSDVVKWARWIEFLSGILLSKRISKSNKKNIDGKGIEKIESLLNTYFNNISIYTGLSSGNREYSSIINSAKIYSLFIRGETYPYLLFELRKDLYSNYEEWFKANLGFTYEQAITITKAIHEVYNTRINSGREKATSKAKSYVKELIAKREIDIDESNSIETNYGCYYFFHNCEEILSFTKSELSNISHTSQEICGNYLERLSQTFGYKNRRYKYSFINPLKAPWDYNTLFEKPIIKSDKVYFIPLISMMPEVLFNTFYYDLISDEKYWKMSGEKIYSNWHEEKTAYYLKKIFSEKNVLVRPISDKGNEICDNLVLFDRKVFIIQCKTKRMRYESRIGMDFEKLKSDFDKGIKASFDQALNAKRYLLSKEFPTVLVNNRKITIDRNQISETFLVCVTINSYQNLTTRLANNESSLNIYRKEYPWAISLFDLIIICEILEDPYLFIHYVRRRLEIEKTKFKINADEVDLLGLYITQGLYLEGKRFDKYNAISFSGFSEEIDKYYYEKYECGISSQKPKVKMSDEVMTFIKNIERIDPPYKTDCIIRILDMSEESRNNFLKSIEKIKDDARRDNELHSISILMEKKEFGISFVALNSKGDFRELFRQAFSFASIKKYKDRCTEWVGFGWEKNSKNVLDVAFYLFGKEDYDPEMEKIVKTNIKKGRIYKIR